ncbi:MAG: energy transducer TonB [Candidatus Obscuribacterales bacterium]|nr:energy transducer TonB [Candidatus Obscuribacterales bacterium]
MFTTKDVVRLSDRWFDHSHPDAISRQSRLQSCVVLVTVFHVVMSIAFAKIDEFERARAPKRVVTSEYAFEFMIAPAELKHVIPVPKPVTLLPGKEQETGGLTGARQGSKNEAAPILKDDTSAQNVEKIALNTSRVSNPLISQPLDIPSMQPRPIKNEQLLASSPTGQQINERVDAAAARGIEFGGAGQEEEGAGNSDGRDGEQDGGGDDVLAPSSPIPEKVAPSTPQQVLINVAPYRKQMLIKLSQEWDAPTTKPVRVVLLIDIANDGSLLSAAVVESSGSKKEDRRALDAVHRTTFDPFFPEALFQLKKHCVFKIDLRNYTE